MSYVICNLQTFQLYSGNSYGAKHYETEASAKTQLTKLTKGLAPKLAAGKWVVMNHLKFLKLEPTVEVISIMSGKPVTIRASEVGRCAVDPSMEGYWTM